MTNMPISNEFSLIEQAYSSLRFRRKDGAAFPKWKSGSLCDVAEIVMGQSPSSDSYNLDGHGLPLIQGNADICNRKSAPRKSTTAPGKTCDPGDILVSVRAPAGEVAMCQHTACLGRGVAAVRPSEKQSRDFWYYMLLHSEPKWDRLGQGAIFAAIGGDDLRNFPTLIPELEEQQRIASALSSIDAKIDALKAKKSTLEDYKRGLMQKLFSQEIRFTREDGSSFLDWTDCYLGDVAHIVMGQSPSSESYNDKGQGLPLIQGNADIFDRKSAPKKFTSAPSKTCQPGDILLSVRAPAGEVAMCEHTACLGRGVASVTPMPTESRDFWYYMLLYVEPKWERIGQGAIFAAINGDDLRSFPVQTPQLEEQVKIGEVLSNFDSKIRHVELQISHTEAFKKGLLQELFV